MTTCSVKGQHGQVEETGFNLGVDPSNLRRNPSSTRCFLSKAWTAAAATILATAAAARGIEYVGATAVSDGSSAFNEEEGPGPFHWRGALTGESAQTVDVRRLHVLETADECIESPLLRKEVDPANYEFGCEAIEEMIEGSKTFLGNGQVRDVYLVEYRGKVVVLKVLRDTDDPRTRQAALIMHQKEAVSLDAVRGHSNIVNMLGVCNTTLVAEYHATSIHQVIWANRDSFTTKRVVSMALDAARGLQALHEASVAPIVHFDMKPRQLLLADDGRVMVNDFNMAQFMDTRGSGVACPLTKRGKCRVVAWRAPEQIAGKPLTEKVDIYAMGMIFYSLISGHLPFPTMESGSIMLLRGERPHIDPSWHTGYMQVVQGMWQLEPTERPSARQVVARLEGILDSLPGYE